MNRKWFSAIWITAAFLALSVLFNSFLVYEHIMLYRDIQNDSTRLANGSQMQSGLQSLVQDLVNYGNNKEPAIYLILKKYGVNPPSPPSSPSSPTAKTPKAVPAKNNHSHH